MEVQMIQSRMHMQQPNKQLKTTKSPTTAKMPSARLPNQDFNASRMDPIGGNYSNYNGYFMDGNGSVWNITESFNFTNTTDFSVDYDFQMINSTVSPGDGSWGFCKEWTPAQHNLFQTANFFFAAAFLVPGSFKQSVLLVR